MGLFVAPISNLANIPEAFFILPYKEYTTYKLVLSCLKKLGVDGLKNFHVDFELATIKALKDIFPEATIRLCDVCWK